MSELSDGSDDTTKMFSQIGEEISWCLGCWTPSQMVVGSKPQ